MIIGIPSASINMQLKNVNLIFRGRKYSGQLSINPVINDSTQQNWESAPKQNSIRKNRIDQRPEGSS